MMIRTLRLALLLACCSTALAQPLYKWIEPDGTITFSPEKPEKGIDFQIINADAGVTTSKIAARNSTKDTLESTDSAQPLISQPIRFSAAEHQLNQSAFIADQAGSGSNAGQQASMDSMARQTSGSITQTSVSSTAAVNKQNQCEDLRKRVVSLERRLKSVLTATDMDNTIVHMSKYQRSYEQFCVQ